MVILMTGKLSAPETLLSNKSRDNSCPTLMLSSTDLISLQFQNDEKYTQTKWTQSTTIMHK